MSMEVVPMLDVVAVDNPWAMVAVIATALIPAVGGWLMRRTADESAKRAEEAKPALDEMRKAARLAPEVKALAEALNELQDEIDAMAPVVKIKYPLAVNHIFMINLRYPDVARELPTPGPVAEDMPEMPERDGD